MSLATLQRDAWGRWVLTLANGSQHVPVTVVRANPVTAPDEGVAVMDAEGHELWWCDRLADQPEAMAKALREALQEREFLPEILRLLSVSSFATPSEWLVDTNRGQTRLTLKAEEDIRRLNRDTLLLSDSHGVQYLIREPQRWDRHARRLLDRFM
jgi:hypothetical protein